MKMIAMLPTKPVPSSVFLAGTLHRWKMPSWNAEGCWQASSGRTDTRTADDHETYRPSSKLGLGPQTPLETSLAPRHQSLSGRITSRTTLWFWRRGPNGAKKPTNAVWHPGMSSALPAAGPWSSVHDLRCDRFTMTMRRYTNTSRNT